MNYDPLDALVTAVAAQLRPVWKTLLPLKEFKRPNLGSAWVVIEDPETGRLLLAKRAKTANNAGQWNLFGGGIEPGESPLQTALRELAEEAGIHADPDQVTPLPGTPRNIKIFVLTMTDKQVRKALRLNAREVSKVRWCDPDRLPQNLHKSALGLIHASRATKADLPLVVPVARRSTASNAGKKGRSRTAR